MTFVVPPSFTTVVPVPTSASSPPQNITGPAGVHNSNGDDWWLLLFGGLIGGLLPADVVVPGAIVPAAVPPSGWNGPWTNPAPVPPLSGGGGNGNPSGTSDPTSSTTSTSTTATCNAVQTSVYNLPDDSANADWNNLGLDPSYLRKRGENHLNRRQSPRRELFSSAAVNCHLTRV